MKLRVLLFLASVLLLPLDAQTVGQIEIITDRPDITESGVVVPRASLQIENGLTWTLDHTTQTVNLSESLIRFGILDKTEIRFGVPNYSDKIIGSSLQWSPRFGVAWDVFGDSRIVVRTGGGIYYDRFQGNRVFDFVRNPPETARPDS